MNPKSKNCSHCKEPKAVEGFTPNSTKKDGLDGYCKACRKSYGEMWRAKNIVRVRERDAARRRNIPLKVRDSRLRYEYGISLEQERSMHEQQKGLCAICRLPETAKCNDKVKRLAVDHDKETGKVRGLLCQRCNQSLGLLKEDFDRALNLAKYIQLHKDIV